MKKLILQTKVKVKVHSLGLPTRGSATGKFRGIHNPMHISRKWTKEDKIILRHDLYIYLSYDVAVIQWIRHVIKSYDHTCNNTLARTRNVIDNDHVN